MNRDWLSTAGVAAVILGSLFLIADCAGGAPGHLPGQVTGKLYRPAYTTVTTSCTTSGNTSNCHPETHYHPARYEVAVDLGDDGAVVNVGASRFAQLREGEQVWAEYRGGRFTGWHYYNDVRPREWE